MMQRKYHLAQFNYAVAKDDVSSIVMQGFIAELGRINGLADSSSGFVWRMQTESGDAIDIKAFPEDERRLITLSVWESLEDFFEFTYKGGHREIMRQRHEWFEKIKEIYLVLWWIPAGQIPTLEESKERLLHLQKHGPTPFAFTIKEHFAPTAQQQKEEK